MRCEQLETKRIIDWRPIAQRARLILEAQALFFHGCFILELSRYCRPLNGGNSYPDNRASSTLELRTFDLAMQFATHITSQVTFTATTSNNLEHKKSSILFYNMLLYIEPAAPKEVQGHRGPGIPGFMRYERSTPSTKDNSSLPETPAMIGRRCFVGPESPGEVAGRSSGEIVERKG